MTENSEIIELSVVVDSEAAEAVSELFNRYNGGDYDEDSANGSAAGGGAVIEGVGYEDDEYQNVDFDSAQRLTVKTYIKPDARGREIQRRIEEGLWRLSLITTLPEPQIRMLRMEDWAHAWKKFYKPLRVGKRVILKPSWEEFTAPDDAIVVELDPGMAFGTGLHPSTRLCIAALEDLVQAGDQLLDVGTGSGVLSIVALKLGARHAHATDVDIIAVNVARENAQLNGIPVVESAHALTQQSGAIFVEQGSVPAAIGGQYSLIVANILAEVLVKLFDCAYENVALAEPLAPGGHIILAGILCERAALVTDALQRHGLEKVGERQEGDWVALIARRPD